MSAVRQQRRQKTLAKLGWVCGQIEQILAGQDVRLADIELPHERAPGETELERLQRFKALLSDTLAELNRGEARRCRRCGAALAEALLDELPWADVCASCAG